MQNRLSAAKLLLLLVFTQAAFAQETKSYEGTVVTTTTYRGEQDSEGNRYFRVEETPEGEQILTEISPEQSIEGNDSYALSSAFELRVFPIMEEAQREGKLLFGHLIEVTDPYGDVASLIGLSEAQKLHIIAFNEGIEERFEDEGLDEIDDVNEEFADKLIGFFTQAVDDFDALIRETLTPIQLQRLQEYELINPLELGFGWSPTINFDAYEVLDLSEEQREQLREIQEEEAAQSRREYAEIEKLSSTAPDKASERLMDSKRLEARVEKVREKIFHEILTPEQREYLETLAEEIPKKLEELRAKRQAESPKKDESWKDAWKPGDPIPEEFSTPTPERRFPIQMRDEK